MFLIGVFFLPMDTADLFGWEPAQKGETVRKHCEPHQDSVCCVNDLECLSPRLISGPRVLTVTVCPFSYKTTLVPENRLTVYLISNKNTFFKG